MTINVTNIYNINLSQNNPYNYKHNSNTQKANAATKTAAALGSVAGVAGALTCISRKNGIKIPSSFKKPKEVLNVLKKLELKGNDVILTASSSILGGLLGGYATDAKNTKAKVKEGVVQLLGNYIIPTIFVSGGIKLNKVLNKNFKFPPITKPIQFAFGFGSLIAGVIAGNKVSREINRNVFNEDAYRKLNWKDWAEQFDNVCLVTSISNTGTNLAKMASRVIPVAHLVPGYLVGVKQENKNM